MSKTETLVGNIGNPETDVSKSSLRKDLYKRGCNKKVCMGKILLFYLKLRINTTV